MTCSYEERSGPVSRRVRRVARRARWMVKRLAGRPVSILVETRWRLGDEVMAIPVYEALRRAYSTAHIAALCHYPELLEGNPFVDAVNPDRVQPDRYILLRGAPRRRYRIKHYCQIADVPVPDAAPRLYYPDWSTPLVPAGGAPLVAVSAGASWLTKRWPIESWRRLCAELEARGCRIVELGLETDDAIDVGTSLRGRTTLREAACVLHAAAVFVGCDSGLMHVALAAGTRVVALFGPTDPSILVRDNQNLTAITVKRDCQGCWNALENAPEPGECPRGRRRCLDTVRVEEVLTVVRRTLER
ncbi:MAG TPA: glycosyltransferase family 9 protein [Candidatus Hydrogenedentes bacterium]|nr:glycosyltransferase family 9 protein [Candidatus Hydrogenedentota bacterium]